MTKAHHIRSAVVPRFSLAVLMLAATLVGAQAQDTTPETKITVDPHAIVDAMPKQGRLLTGLYATQATIEVCGMTVTEPGVTAMNAHRRQLESELRMDEATGQAAYAAVKADVEKTGIDCAEGSSDRQQTEAVISVYSGT